MKKLLINLEVQVNENYEVTAVKLLNQTEVKPVINQSSHVLLLDTKLSFSQEAVDILEAEVGDRIFIYYDVNENTDLIPIVTNSNNTSSVSQGNILKKDNSIIFKGRPRTVLLSHGTEFNLVCIKSTYEKSFQLTPVSQVAAEQPEFDKLLGDIPII